MRLSTPLPEGHMAREVQAADVPALVDLVSRIRSSLGGPARVDVDSLRAEAVGIGSWTRRQLLVTDPSGAVCAWVCLHDRAAGRSDLTLHVDRGVTERAALAGALLVWSHDTARALASDREVERTRVETLVDADDEELAAWLAASGHRRTRTWLNMTRPVGPDDAPSGQSDPSVVASRPGVRVRRVRVHDLGDGTTMPVAADLHSVHRVLERSFEDHYNSYRESFPEFVQRLREDPGHRWDHWWLALVDVEGTSFVGGALVSSLLAPDAKGATGSSVDYIGVDRRARGRGVAKALLVTVVADAAARGRNRVGLEVDADSPTGADGLYRSLGWTTDSVTQSWPIDLTV